LYERLNVSQQNYIPEPITKKLAEPVIEAPAAISTEQPAARRPMFKPTFKKPQNE